MLGSCWEDRLETLAIRDGPYGLNGIPRRVVGAQAAKGVIHPRRYPKIPTLAAHLTLQRNKFSRVIEAILRVNYSLPSHASRRATTRAIRASPTPAITQRASTLAVDKPGRQGGLSRGPTQGGGEAVGGVILAGVLDCHLIYFPSARPAASSFSGSPNKNAFT